MAKSGKAFVADLPEMSEEQLEKIYVWGNSSCDQFDLHLQEGGGMTLVAVRKKSGSARDHMRLLRTNLQNWGVILPVKQVGWLRLVDESASAEDKISQAATIAETSDPHEDVAGNAPDADTPPTVGSAMPIASNIIVRQNCSAQLELPKNLLISPSDGGRLCRAA